MNIRPVLFALIASAILAGCTTGGNPVSNSPNSITPLETQRVSDVPQTHLWGYYDVYVDVENQTVTAVQNRSAMFAANVVFYMNKSPMSMIFQLLEVKVQPGFIDVDLNLTLKHPFSGMPQYNGYDVRGIILTDGSTSMASDSDLVYSTPGVDQMLIDDPSVAGADQPGGGPDGYSRWWNAQEFLVPGVLGYTVGNNASGGYTPTATLNPYKYFADGLGPYEEAMGWLEANPGSNGVFTSGSQNTRNMYIRFPSGKGTNFGYAVLVNWMDAVVPANAPETLAIRSTEVPDIYYAGPGDSGGNLILDLEVFDWGTHTLIGGVMTDYTITVESTVMSAPHVFTPDEMTPVGQNGNTFQYFASIPADNVTGVDGNEYWVLVSYNDYDYTNIYGVPNSAWASPLTASFRKDLAVSTVPFNFPPVCDLIIDPSTPMPAQGIGSVPVMFDASGSTDPDVGDMLSFSWDFDGDGLYGETGDDDYTGNQDTPTHAYTESYVGPVYVKVLDLMGHQSVCSVDVDVTIVPSKLIDLRAGVTANDIAVRPTNGDLYILYSDGAIYKRSDIDGYIAETLVISGAVTMTRMDVAANGAMGMCGGNNFRNYDGNGNLKLFTGWEHPQVDVTTYSETSTWPNAISYCFGVQMYNPSTQMYTYYTYWSTYTNPYAFGNLIHWPYWLWVPDNPFPVAYNRVWAGYVRGYETDGDSVWYLQNSGNYDGYYCSRFKPDAGIGQLLYYNSYFGTGVRGDADTTWNNAKDLVRLEPGYFYVLDQLSTGEPKVKVFVGGGTGGASVGSFGDSTNIASPPLRMAGADYNGYIFVISGSGAPTKLSIFTPAEMP